MLILSRKTGDAILVEGGIRIVVLGIDGGAVRLGIEAPSSVGVVREEIAERIAEENRRAGETLREGEWVSVLGGVGHPTRDSTDNETADGSNRSEDA